MGLLDGLEKLINEHGSAVILKERIDLANDRYAALERKATEFEAENKNLKLEIQDLRRKLKDLEGVAAQGGGEIDDVSQGVLLLLAKNGQMNAGQIAHTLKIGQELAEFHLNDLSDIQFVFASHSPYETAYGLDQEGRRYLAKRGLLR
jgi:hypothetical protein